ncbi:MAG: hypothetical protein WC990_02125 [Sphaerochaetaceae bacterium]
MSQSIVAEMCLGTQLSLTVAALKGSIGSISDIKELRDDVYVALHYNIDVEQAVIVKQLRNIIKDVLGIQSTATNSELWVHICLNGVKDKSSYRFVCEIINAAYYGVNGDQLGYMLSDSVKPGRGQLELSQYPLFAFLSGNREFCIAFVERALRHKKTHSNLQGLLTLLMNIADNGARIGKISKKMECASHHFKGS